MRALPTYAPPKDLTSQSIYNMPPFIHANHFALF